MKSCTSTSRAVSKKIERKLESVVKGKNKVKIIDENGFTKLFNTHRSPSLTPGPAAKTLTPKLRIIKLVSDWDELESVDTRKIMWKGDKDGCKVKGPLPGPSKW